MEGTVIVAMSDLHLGSLLGERWLAGLYEVGGMTVIVCGGTGTWGPRMRLWHRGEILRLTLGGKET